MFNWMNRRVYWTIRLWFKAASFVALIFAIIFGIIFSITWVGKTYGQGVAMLTFLALAINVLTAFMSYMYSNIRELDERQLIKQYKNITNPPLSWRPFGWMNRRVYYAIITYLSVIGAFSIVISIVVGIILLADYIGKLYGPNYAIFTILACVAFVGSIGLAWGWAQSYVEKEKQEQDRILKSLKRDW